MNEKKILVIPRKMMVDWLNPTNSNFELINQSSTLVISINEFTHWDGQYKGPSPFDSIKDFKVHKIIMHFDDRDQNGEWNEMHYKLFDNKMAKNIIKNVNKLKNDINTIIVHCTAGISRSGAVGVFLSEMLGWQLETANSIIPNTLVLKELRGEFQNSKIN